MTSHTATNYTFDLYACCVCSCTWQDAFCLKPAGWASQKLNTFSGNWGTLKTECVYPLKSPLQGKERYFLPPWLQRCLAFVKPWGWLLVLYTFIPFVGTVKTCGFLHSSTGRAAGPNIPGCLHQPWQCAQRGQDIRPGCGSLPKSTQFEPQPRHCSWQLGLRLLWARVSTQIWLPSPHLPVGPAQPMSWYWLKHVLCSGRLYLITSRPAFLGGDVVHWLTWRHYWKGSINISKQKTNLTIFALKTSVCMLIVFIIILTWWILTCGVNNNYDWLKLIAPGTHPYWVIPHPPLLSDTQRNSMFRIILMMWWKHTWISPVCWYK